MSWAQTEFEGIDLGEARRNHRAIRMIDNFSAKPGSSIRQASGDWAETIAAYRFFGNDDIEWADILAPHLRRTAQPLQRL